MGVLSDEELVDRYRALGDTRREEFLDQLFERHRTRVAAWCYRMTGDVDAVTDLAQDVFFKAFQNLGGAANCAKTGAIALFPIPSQTYLKFPISPIPQCGGPGIQGW